MNWCTPRVITTDNDRGAGYPFEMAGWKVAGNYSKVTDTQIQIEDDSVKVTYVHELPGLSDVEVKVTYQVDYKGRIFVTATIMVKQVCQTSLNLV